MNDSTLEAKGYSSITQAHNWYLRVKGLDGKINLYPVAVWAAYGDRVKGLVSMFKGESPCLYTPPPASISQYVHGDQLTDDEKQLVQQIYPF